MRKGGVLINVVYLFCLSKIFGWVVNLDTSPGKNFGPSQVKLPTVGISWFCLGFGRGWGLLFGKSPGFLGGGRLFGGVVNLDPPFKM